MGFLNDPNFDVYSRYLTTAGIDIVRFGADAQVLESELNESQQRADFKVANLMRQFFNDGVKKLDSMHYNSPTFTISDTYALVGGHLIYVSNLSMVLSNGDIYLDTWLEEVTGKDIIKKYGNQQETETVDNWFIDEYFGEETSRRMQRQYTLSPAPVRDDHDYLLLGSVNDNIFSQASQSITSKITKNNIREEFIAGEGQLVYNLTQGLYTPNAGQMNVYIGGIMAPSESYEETSTTSITFVSPVPAGNRITVIYG